MTTDVVSPGEGDEKPQEKKSFDLVSILVEKVTGTVKWFSVPRHYGFIQRDDNNEDVFVHRNSIAASKQRFPTLKTGEPVEFSIVETVSGVNAESVTGPGGRPVKGSRRYTYRSQSAFKSPGAPQDAPLNTAEGDGGVQPNAPSAEGDVVGPRQMRRRRRRGFGRRPQQSNRDELAGYENEGENQPRDGVSPHDGAPLPRPRPHRGRGRYMGGRFAPNGPRHFPPNDGPDQQQQPRRPSFRGRGRFGRGRRPPMSYDNSEHRQVDDTVRSLRETDLVHDEGNEVKEHPLENEMVNLTLDETKNASDAVSSKCDFDDVEKQSPVGEEPTAPELKTEMS